MSRALRGRAAICLISALAINGCGSGGEGPPDPALATHNSIYEALSREVPEGAHLEKLACGSDIEEVEAESVETFGGVEGGCTGYFANGVGSVNIPYNVSIKPDWCFTMEVPYESITGIDEGGGAPPIEGSPVVESAGAGAAGGVLGNVSGCVHPKPED